MPEKGLFGIKNYIRFDCSLELRNNFRGFHGTCLSQKHEPEVRERGLLFGLGSSVRGLKIMVLSTGIVIGLRYAMK